MQDLGKKVAITSTSGITASQFQNAVTLHRRSGILDGRFSNDKAVRRARGQADICKRICATDVLIFYVFIKGLCVGDFL